MSRINNELGFAAALALRLRTTPLRLVLMGAIAGMLWKIGHWPFAPLWFAAYAGLQGVVVLAGRQAWSDTAAGQRLHYVLATANYALAGLPAWHLWTRCGDLGVATAVMFLCGMLVQLIVGSLGATRLFWFSAAPLIGYLLVLPPLAWGAQRLADGLAVTACGVCLMSYMSVLWSGHQKALVAGEASRLAAVQARRDAEHAAQAKGAFLATMSHEIRTPMNAVLGAATLLGQTQLDDRQAEYVGMISNAGSVLMTVLNDVLDLSKIEAGKFEIIPVRTDLHALVRRCVDLWRPQAMAKGLSFETRVTPDTPGLVSVDAARLSQILFNLLSNALKFTLRGGVTLVVDAEPLGPGVVRLSFTVSDTGPGIAAEILPRLFDAFEQADQSISRRFGGTGLGLAISQRLAGLMGGEITVHSDLGRGSAFRLSLPARLADRPDLPARPVSPPAIGRRLRVLAAEDNAVNRRLIEAFLSPLDISLTFAGNGLEALEALQAEAFDVVLMDIQMPLMDGVEATRRLRAGGGPNATTPVIALTANIMADQCESYRAAGMDAQIAKPIDAPSLLAAIVECAERRPAPSAQRAAPAADRRALASRRRI